MGGAVEEAMGGAGVAAGNDSGAAGANAPSGLGGRATRGGVAVRVAGAGAHAGGGRLFGQYQGGGAGGAGGRGGERSRRWAGSWTPRARAASRPWWRRTARGEAVSTTGVSCRRATLVGASCGAACTPRRTSSSCLRSRRRVGSFIPPHRRAVALGSGLEAGPEGAHVDVDLVGGMHLLSFQHAFGVAGVRLPAGAQEGSGAPVHDDVDATGAVGAAPSAGPWGLQRGGAVGASWVGYADLSRACEQGGPA